MHKAVQNNLPFGPAGRMARYGTGKMISLQKSRFNKNKNIRTPMIQLNDLKGKALW
jgi:hypothetical protein